MSNLVIPDNLKGKDLYKFLTANKSTLIAQKKFQPKFGDPFALTKLYVDKKGNIVKAAVPPDPEQTDVIEVVAIINTTMWMDSHDDVHIDGLWKKSLQENRMIYHLQEHKMTFQGIITDEVNAYTRIYKWSDLGVEAEGNTEALVFESRISKNRNPYMFDQYKLGHVKNHSVGMQYVRLELAINDEDYKEEFAVWSKYIDDIANKDEVTEQGYFWAIKEAKVIEGSAVPIGSNIITPTQSVSSSKSTENQPPVGTETPPQPKGVDWEKMASFIN